LAFPKVEDVEDNDELSICTELPSLAANNLMENVGCLYRGHNPGFHDRACRSAGGGAQSNGGRARPDAGHKHSLGGLPLLALAIPLFFLFTGLGARLHRMCESISGRGSFWTVTLFACVYLILAALIALPFDFYGDYIQPHVVGWSHETWPHLLKGESAQLSSDWSLHRC
jgi:hypothetical protein